jgi:hypothetical protein
VIRALHGAERRFDDVTIRSYSGMHNQDGLDIDSCRNAEVKNLRVISGDDGIVFKAMSMREARDLHIHDCNIYSHSSGIKFGTETHGGVNGVVIEDCRVDCERGAMAVESVDGASMENIVYRNITITQSGSPVFIRLGNRGRKLRSHDQPLPPGTIKNILFENIAAVGTKDTYGCAIAGIPSNRIDSVVLRNIDFLMKGGRDSLLDGPSEELSNEYPKSDMFGDQPAYAFWVRHADNVSFENVSIRCASPDIRPAIGLDDVMNCSLNNVNTQSPIQLAPN